MLFLAFRILSHTLTGQSNAKDRKRRQRKYAQNPEAHAGKTPAYRLCSGTPGKLARAARDARMHGLSTLTRGTERILPRPSDPAGFTTKKTAPGLWRGRPEADGAACWREGAPNARQSAERPLARRGCTGGALAFRDGYLSFGASFTACPRLATTGMVMALAGHASTQALQCVQSASVRSP